MSNDFLIDIWGSRRSIRIEVLEVNEFELQSRYYVHFRINTLGKSMKPPNSTPALYKIASLLFFYKDGFSIK